GANIIHDVGYTTFGLAHSCELVVMMNDAIGRVRRIFDGVNTTDEYLAMDDMREVGPKGHYLAQESTLVKNRENWESALEDRNEYDRWMALGGKTMGQRAKERVQDIILNGELNTMSPEKDAAIVAILDRIDKAEKESMM
ncbi:MAG: trimethylamine methyltransferase family protein, partial [Clostridia bacterium]|nr:trimethylamine methyltransferase family protein [Clostridia bacterium]